MVQSQSLTVANSPSSGADHILAETFQASTKVAASYRDLVWLNQPDVVDRFSPVRRGGMGVVSLEIIWSLLNPQILYPGVPFTISLARIVHICFLSGDKRFFYSQSGWPYKPFFEQSSHEPRTVGKRCP